MFTRHGNISAHRLEKGAVSGVRTEDRPTVFSVFAEEMDSIFGKHTRHGKSSILDNICFIFTAREIFQ
jgi:hypothetical protein